MTKAEQSIHNDICEFLRPFNLKIDDVSGQLWKTYKSNNMYIRRCMFHFLHFNKKYSYRKIGNAVGIHHSMVAHNISMLIRNEEKDRKDNILSYDQQRRMFNYLKIF
jgi:hypothetical protein